MNIQKIGTVKVHRDKNAFTSPQMSGAQLMNYIRENLNVPEDLPVDYKTDLILLLIKYPHLFAQDHKDSGRTELVRHKINTQSSNPVRKFPDRTSPKEKGNNY